MSFGGPPLRDKPSGIHEAIEAVNACMGILSVFDSLGIETLPALSNRVRYRCPLHGDGTDREPSGMLYLDTNRWWCFGCNAGGDMIQAVRAFSALRLGHAYGFREALAWLTSQCGAQSFSRRTRTKDEGLRPLEKHLWDQFPGEV